MLIIWHCNIHHIVSTRCSVVVYWSCNQWFASNNRLAINCSPILSMNKRTFVYTSASVCVQIAVLVRMTFSIPGRLEEDLHTHLRLSTLTSQRDWQRPLSIGTLRVTLCVSFIVCGNHRKSAACHNMVVVWIPSYAWLCIELHRLVKNRNKQISNAPLCAWRRKFPLQHQGNRVGFT